MTDLVAQFGQIDIYLFDQLLRGRIRPGMRILDAGCGGGRNLVYMLKNGFDVSADGGGVRLHRVLRAGDYLPTIRRGLDEVGARAERPGLVLYNAGMDPFEGCAVGGYPTFVQGDPRPGHRGRETTLLVNLDCTGDLFMFGDAGSAQLFGNPAALAAGKLDSLWWNWSCF